MLLSEKNLTILVVDDNPTNLAVLHNALNSEGYKVRVEVDGHQALTQIALRPPDLILLDVMLPDIDGFQICRQLKASPATEPIPVIFMTALADTKDKVKGLGLGAVDYITKPFQQEEVLARVSLHLKLRHLSLSLEDKNHKLEQLTAELEQRVEERTLKLSDSLDELQKTKEQLTIANQKLQEDAQLLENKVKERTQQLQQEVYERQQTSEALAILNEELEDRVEQRTIALRESREYLYQITENIENIFWIRGLDNNQLIYVSSALEKIWGLTPDELYSQPKKWLEAIVSEDLPKVLQAIPQQILGSYDLEYRIIGPQQQIRWIRDRAFPICDQSGQVYRIAGVADDITQQKQIQETLKLQERAISASNNGMMIIDARLPDYPIIFVNPAFEKITGYSVEEVIGKNCLFFTAEDDNQGALNQLKRALSEGKNCTVNLRNHRRDGSILWNELSISPIYAQENLTHFIAIQTDITKRIKAERKLKQQLTAIEAAIDGIAILDNQARHIYANQSYLKMFNYDQASELIGKSLAKLYPTDEWQKFTQDIFPELQSNGNWQGEARVSRKDGSTFVEEVSFTIIKNIGLVCVCRDISDRKQAEKKLRKSLQEKELLLKEIHHRVKNNLLVVSSLLDLQINYIEDSPEVVKIFEECQQRIHSMALIHEKLYQSKSLAKINFSEYIETLVQQLFYSFNLEKGRVQLKLDLEPVSLNIETATPCGLIISELIANVMEHAFPANRSGEIWIQLEKWQENFKLTIQDNGIGLPQSFDLNTAETLGLKLISLLTKQIKGKLNINNHDGTTFELIFSELKYNKRV